MAELRQQHLKPRVEQLDEFFSGHRDLRTLMRYAHLFVTLGQEARRVLQKVRVHRGRQYLNKKADIQPSSLSEDLELPASNNVVPTPSAELATTADEAEDFGPNVIAFRPRRLA